MSDHICMHMHNIHKSAHIYFTKQILLHWSYLPVYIYIHIKSIGWSIDPSTCKYIYICLHLVYSTLILSICTYIIIIIIIYNISCLTIFIYLIVAGIIVILVSSVWKHWTTYDSRLQTRRSIQALNETYLTRET